MNEKRITTVHSRFHVCCSLCGFLESEQSFREAVNTAKILKQKHNDASESIIVFDSMAHHGASDEWEVK